MNKQIFEKVATRKAQMAAKLNAKRQELSNAKPESVEAEALKIQVEIYEIGYLAFAGVEADQGATVADPVLTLAQVAERVFDYGDLQQNVPGAYAVAEEVGMALTI